jgi:polar amino acid transport system substrate-binding protein
MRKIPALLLGLAAALAAAGCGSSTAGSSTSSGNTSGNACAPSHLKTLTPGTLTIGTDNPAYSPYFTGGPGHTWKGQYNNDPYKDKGFEDVMAYTVAKTMGFPYGKVKWAYVPFNNSYKPGPKPFDFYLAQVSYTPQRAQAVDFSSSYYNVNQAVVALKSDPISHVTSIAGLRKYHLGTQVGTTSYQFITGTIKPSQTPNAYSTLNEAISGLKAGQIDGIVIDLPTAFYMTAVQIPNSVIVGQFPSSLAGGHFGLVLSKGSSLTGCVDRALATMRANGSMAQITKTWLSDKANAPILK